MSSKLCLFDFSLWFFFSRIYLQFHSNITEIINSYELWISLTRCNTCASIMQVIPRQNWRWDEVLGVRKRTFASIVSNRRSCYNSVLFRASHSLQYLANTKSVGRHLYLPVFNPFDSKPLLLHLLLYFSKFNSFNSFFIEIL